MKHYIFQVESNTDVGGLPRLLLGRGHNTRSALIDAFERMGSVVDAFESKASQRFQVWSKSFLHTDDVTVSLEYTYSE